MGQIMMARIEESGMTCTSKAAPGAARGDCDVHQSQMPGKRIEPQRPFLDTLNMHDLCIVKRFCQPIVINNKGGVKDYRRCARKGIRYVFC